MQTQIILLIPQGDPVLNVLVISFALQELFPYRMLVPEVCPFSNQISIINEVNILNIAIILNIKFSLMHIAKENGF